VSLKADQRKREKLVMPLSIEEQLRQLGFSTKAIQDAAESIHGKSSTTRGKDLTTEMQKQDSTKRTKSSKSQGLDSKRSGKGEKVLTTEEQRAIDEKIKQLKLDGRMLPNSAMTTYFGKPAFHAYGNGNTRPTNGGLSYGQYMKTHNINPHSGDNHPEFAQVYAHAMLEPKMIAYKNKGKSKSPKKTEADTQHSNKLVRKPQPPRQARPKRPLTAKQLEEQRTRNPITQDLLEGKHNVPIVKPQIKPDVEVVEAKKTAK
jgi:hypothetical protein